MMDFCGRPTADEAAEFYWTYIQLVPEGDVKTIAAGQVDEVQSLLSGLPETVALQVHPPYTWTIKQVVGHLIDAERIFANRLHRFACGDLQPLPGMEQDPYVANCDYVTPTLAALVAELTFCRQANSLLLERLTPAAWNQRGVASGHPVTVRALAYILVGHITYHLQILKKRLLVVPLSSLSSPPLRL